MIDIVCVQCHARNSMMDGGCARCGFAVTMPDPLTVTGMLRWDENGHLYFGKIYVGREFKDMFGHYQAVPENWVSLKRIDKPTREEARAALEQAVKEAIGG